MEISDIEERTVLEGAAIVDSLEVGLVVKTVTPGTLGEELGLEPGDTIVAVGGKPVRDAIDFRFMFGEEGVELSVQRSQERLIFEIEKDPDEDLGVAFEDMDILKCDNKCVFCFLHQMPKKLRKTLYYQDDDYRLSFLHGAYITLTNLSDEEFDRIVTQRLSPMYVSVHATDPDVRGHLLGRRGASDVMGRLDYLIEQSIQIHTQVVLCPGINDGSQLDRTIRDLADRYPAVESLGVVPLGLTKFRQNLPDLAPITSRDCERALEQIHAHQDRFLSELGTRFVYAGDEFYLQRGTPPPEADRYDGFPLLENGIGMVRRFLDDFESGYPTVVSHRPSETITVVTGALGDIFIRPMADRLSTLDGLTVNVVPIQNDFLGQGITVSGLLAGEDILAQLKGRELGGRILLPPNCVNHDGILLDDVTPADLSKALGANVEVGSYSLVDTILGDEHRSHAKKPGIDHPYIASHQVP